MNYSKKKYLLNFFQVYLKSKQYSIIASFIAKISFFFYEILKTQQNHYFHHSSKYYCRIERIKVQSHVTFS